MRAVMSPIIRGSVKADFLESDSIKENRHLANIFSLFNSELSYNKWEAVVMGLSQSKAKPEDFEFPPPIQTRGIFFVSFDPQYRTILTTTQMSSFRDMQVTKQIT